MAACHLVSWRGVGVRVGRVIALLSCGLAFGCSSKPASDLPSGWENAQEISLSVSECTEMSEPPVESVSLSATEDEVSAEFLSAGFRCSQEICAYHLEEGGTGKVLVQPCELHPDVVAKCSCRYDIEFEFPRPSKDKVEIWKGTDAYGGEAEQSLVHEEEL